MSVFDIHTHSRTAPDRESVLCIGTDRNLVSSEGLYSAGVHPWYLDAAGFAARMSCLEELLALDNVVALGECGLDSLRGPSIEFQRQALLAQLDLASAVHKPVVLHVVRRFDMLLPIRRQFGADGRWLIHGFRGGVIQMKQLLDAGFFLSFGLGARQETLAAVPEYSLILETDGKCPISEVQTLAASARNCTVQEISRTSAAAADHFLGMQ